MKLRIAGTENDSIVDGPGLRFTIFTQGCPHHCPGCHNPQTHDFNGGKDVDTAELLEKIRSNPLLDGVTFSGGEPFCQAKPLAALGRALREMGLHIISYTGFTYEQLQAAANEENGYAALLSVCDYLVDGRFEEDKKSYLLHFRGSSNQRFIDVPASLAAGHAVLAEALTLPESL